jgi:hypothetical protein
VHDAVSTGGGPGILFQWLKPIEQGLNVKLTSGLHEGCLRFVTPKDSGITSLSQAKGKTIRHRRDQRLGDGLLLGRSRQRRHQPREGR